MKKLLLLALFVLLLPTASQASGTLVKSPSFSAVYYLGTDGKRYVFPNENVYKSWYGDFSGVTTITDEQLYASPIGGNVTYKPGSKMVKITTDPKVYAVDRNGTLRWIVGEEVATSLYGSDWAQNVNDIPDAFFVNYSVGSPITSVSDFSPVERMSVASISEDKTLGGIGAVDEPVAVAPIQQPAQTTNTQTAPALQIVKFQSDKTTVKPGETFKLSWEATGATTCALTKDLNSITIPFTGHLPSGETPAYGLENLGTFHLVCADKDWNTKRASVTVSKFVDTTPLAFVVEPKVTATSNASGVWSASLTYEATKPVVVTGMPTDIVTRSTYNPTLRFTDEQGNYLEKSVSFSTGAGVVSAQLQGYDSNRFSDPQARIYISSNDPQLYGITEAVFEVRSQDVTFADGAKLQLVDNGTVFSEVGLSNGLVALTGLNRGMTNGTSFTVKLQGATSTVPGARLEIRLKSMKVTSSDISVVSNPEAVTDFAVWTR